MRLLSMPLNTRCLASWVANCASKELYLDPLLGELSEVNGIMENKMETTIMGYILYVMEPIIIELSIIASKPATEASE